MSAIVLHPLRAPRPLRIVAFRQIPSPCIFIFLAFAAR
jgi:hypothetical protein